MSAAMSRPFIERVVTAVDGVRLALRDYEPVSSDGGARLPVICLPGLSRNSRDFHPLAVNLSSAGPTPRRVLALDYRGRGQSAFAEDKTTYTIAQEANDVLQVMAVLDIPRALFIGTSRGGLILHSLVEHHADRLGGVVLNDIGPVIETAGLIGIRHTLKAQARFDSWAAALSALRTNHAAAFPALTAEDWQEMAQAIFIENGGDVVSDYDPALIAPLEFIEPDMTLPTLWESYDRFSTLPLMAIRAEHSTILREETFLEMAERHPHLKSVIAYGQGHAPLLHLEPVRSRISDFLDSL